GEPIVTQGQQGDSFYVVAAGELAVTVDGRDVITLGDGDSFGEIALLRNVPRTATVRALVDSSLVVVHRDDFLATVTGYAPSLSSAEAAVGLRLGTHASAGDISARSDTRR